MRRRSSSHQKKANKRQSISTAKITKELTKAERRKKYFTKEDQLSRIQKYEENDKKNKYYKPFQGDQTFRGPKARKRVTDRIFVPGFLILNAIFLIYGVIALKDGAFLRLIHGFDFRSELCGVGKLTSRPYLYFANAVIDTNVKFCVEKCPNTSGGLICLYDVDPDIMTDFCYIQLQSTTSGTYCLPVEPVNKKFVDEEMSSLMNLAKRGAGDLILTVDVIIVGSILSVVIAVVFFELIRRPEKTKTMVWLSILGTTIAIFGLAYFFRLEYLQTIEERCLLGIDREGCGGFKAWSLKLLMYAAAGFAIIYVFIIIRMRKKIKMGIGLIKLSGRVLSNMLGVRILPFIIILLSISIGTFFITCLASAFSVGTVKLINAENIDGGQVYTIEYSILMRVLAVLFFIMFQWWVNLILLIADTIISYAIAVWYFEKKKETVVLDLVKFAKIIFKNHLGTIAMLAIYKIIFKLERTLLGGIRKLLRKAKQHSNFIRFSQAFCLACIHWDFRFLRFISKHLLVQMCIWGDAFRISSQKAYFLLMRHPTKVKKIDFLSTFILFQTKFFCALLGGLFVYAYLLNFTTTVVGTDLEPLDSFIAPSAIAIILGFFYATTFQGLFDISIKAITQCYLLDEEMFVGDQKFSVDFITNFMDEYSREMNLKEMKIQKIKQELHNKNHISKITPGIVFEKIDDEDEESGVSGSNQSGSSGSNNSGSRDSDEDDESGSYSGSGSDSEDESGSDSGSGSGSEDSRSKEDESEEIDSEESKDKDDSHDHSINTNVTSQSRHRLMQSNISLKIDQSSELPKAKTQKGKKSDDEEEESDEEDDDNDDDDDDESEEEDNNGSRIRDISHNTSVQKSQLIKK